MKILIKKLMKIMNLKKKRIQKSQKDAVHLKVEGKVVQEMEIV